MRIEFDKCKYILLLLSILIMSAPGSDTDMAGDLDDACRNVHLGQLAVFEVLTKSKYCIGTNDKVEVEKYSSGKRGVIITEHNSSGIKIRETTFRDGNAIMEALFIGDTKYRGGVLTDNKIAVYHYVNKKVHKAYLLDMNLGVISVSPDHGESKVPSDMVFKYIV